MRGVLALVGLGFLILIIGGLLIHSRSTVPVDTDGVGTTTSETMTTSSFLLSSPEFAPNESIPSRYTCDGNQVNPPLSINGVPNGAQSLALLLNDPDVPKALKPDGNFDHWVLFNISPTTTEITTGMKVGVLGNNGAGKPEYRAPCPPSQYEPSEHRYFFRIFALDIELPLKEGASKADVEKAMEGHVIGQAELIGRYKKK